MTRQEKLDKVLAHMANNLDEIPTRPDLICENAGLKVERAEGYSMLDMMLNDGYVGCYDEKRTVYTIRYKGIIFLDNGGYSLEHRHYKRQQLAKKISDCVDIVVKPIGIFTLLLSAVLAAIQIYKFFYCTCAN